MTIRPTRRSHPTTGLGRVQTQVLASLAHDDRSVRTITMDWPGLIEGSVRSAIDSLGMRGLVDAVRFDGKERVWGLTRKGSEFVKGMWGDGDELAERIERLSGEEAAVTERGEV